MSAPEKLKWAIEIPEDTNIDVQVLVAARNVLLKADNEARLRILDYLKDEFAKTQFEGD